MNTGCDVVIGESGGEYPPEYYLRRIVTARKKYRCYECERPIVAGQRYERVVGKWDGCADSHTTCLDCVALAEAFGDGNRFHGALWEELTEQLLPEMSTACLDKIDPARPSAKAYLLERWRKWKGLHR